MDCTFVDSQRPIWFLKLWQLWSWQIHSFTSFSQKCLGLSFDHTSRSKQVGGSKSWSGQDCVLHMGNDKALAFDFCKSFFRKLDFSLQRFFQRGFTDLRSKSKEPGSSCPATGVSNVPGTLQREGCADEVRSTAWWVMLGEKNDGFQRWQGTPSNTEMYKFGRESIDPAGWSLRIWQAPLKGIGCICYPHVAHGKLPSIGFHQPVFTRRLGQKAVPLHTELDQIDKELRAAGAVCWAAAWRSGAPIPSIGTQHCDGKIHQLGHKSSYVFLCLPASKVRYWQNPEAQSCSPLSA